MQCQLHRAVTVAPGTLDRDVFPGHPADGEGLENPIFPLDHKGGVLALGGFDGQQSRGGSATHGAIYGHVDTSPTGDFHDALQRVFIVHVDDIVGSHGLGHF